MHPIDVFTTHVLKKFTEQITDRLFLFIEEDAELMQKYLNVIAVSGDLKYVNSTIAKAVKEKFGLANTGAKEDDPESLLIQSYEKFR